jgi:hypothetical protein
MYALVMFSNDLRMIETDKKMLELQPNVRKTCNFNISAFVGLIV